MMPNVNKAIFGLGQRVQFTIVQKKVVDYEEVDNRMAVRETVGSLQPFPDRELEMMPEGQRKWKHWTYYTQDKLELDWELCDLAGKQYRVVSTQDWSQAGYVRYVLTEQPIV